MNRCPNRQVLGTLLAGGLDAPVDAALAAHVEVCAACQRLLDELVAGSGPDWSLLRRDEAGPTPQAVLRMAAVTAGGTPRPRREGWKKETVRPATLSPAPLPRPVSVPGYELLEELGRGGVGVVYKARQVQLNRLVALKMMSAGDLADSASRVRFRAEAEAVARLTHPNIIAIYEVGEHEGRLWFAMELADGGALSARLEGRPQPPRAAADLVAVLARAVGHAHERGVFHRDLKPSNILLHQEGTAGAGGSTPIENQKADATSFLGVDPPAPAVAWVPKVADFGLAQRAGDVRLTQTGQLLGTPGYMAPEQLSPGQAPVGPAADVYALGAILYECLTGRPPFLAETVSAVLAQAQHDEPLPPRRFRPGIPRDLETVCLKCLEKEPHRRYASAAELADDLRRFLAGEPVRARPISALGRAAKWAKRRPALVALGATTVLVTALAFAGVTAMWRRADQKRSEAEAARAAETEALRAAEDSLYSNQLAQAVLSVRLHDVAQARRVLQACAPERRRWEWHYLDGLTRAELLDLPAGAGPATWVYSVAFSPDGRLLATGAGPPEYARVRPKTPGALKIWDARTGKLRLDLTGQTLAISSLAFSPDGRHLAAAEVDVRGSWSGPLRVWNVATGEPVVTIAPPRAYVEVLFSPDGRRLAARFPDPSNLRDAGLAGAVWGPGEVAVFDAATGAEHFQLQAQWRCAFSPDGRRLLSTGEDGRWAAWDAVAGGRLETVNAAPAPGLLSPDGKLTAALEKGGSLAILRAASDGRLVHSFSLAPAAKVVNLAFGPDGRVLAGVGTDGTARLWDACLGAEQGVFSGHHARALSLAFSPGGDRLATGGWDGAVRVWDLTRDPATLHLPAHDPLPGYMVKTVDDLRVRPNGRELVTVQAPSGLVQTWDLVTGQRRCGRRFAVSELQAIPGQVLALDSAGLLLAGPASGGLKVWDVTSGQELVTLEGPERRARRVVLGPDGRYVAAAFDPDPAEAGGGSDLRVWDVKTGREVLRHRELGRFITGLAFHPAGDRLAVADGPPESGAGGVFPVRIWQLTSPRLGRTMAGHSSPVLALAFAPDGGWLASAERDGAVRTWDVDGEGALRTWEGPANLTALAFSPDGLRLAGATRTAVTLWDPATGHALLTLAGRPQDRDPPFNPRVIFSPDGTRLIANQWDLSVSVWEAAERTAEAQVRRCRAAEDRVTAWHLTQAVEARRTGHDNAVAHHLRRLVLQLLSRAPGGGPSD